MIKSRVSVLVMEYSLSIRPNPGLTVSDQSRNSRRIKLTF